MGKRHTTCCLISHENPRSKSRGRLRTERRARGTARGSLDKSCYAYIRYDTTSLDDAVGLCARAAPVHGVYRSPRGSVPCMPLRCGVGKALKLRTVTVVESEKDQSLTSLSCIRTKGMMQVNLPRELAKGRALSPLF